MQVYFYLPFLYKAKKILEPVRVLWVGDRVKWGDMLSITIVHAMDKGLPSWRIPNEDLYQIIFVMIFVIFLNNL